MRLNPRLREPCGLFLTQKLSKSLVSVQTWKPFIRETFSILILISFQKSLFFGLVDMFANSVEIERVVRTLQRWDKEI